MFGFEGPTIFKYHGKNKWCLMLDNYARKEGYKPFVTDDIARGVFVSPPPMDFDMIYRHGTVMPITDEEYKRLVEKY